jgi:hypothetical protein
LADQHPVVTGTPRFVGRTNMSKPVAAVATSHVSDAIAPRVERRFYVGVALGVPEGASAWVGRVISTFDDLEEQVAVHR